MREGKQNIHTNVRFKQQDFKQMKQLCEMKNISQSHFIRICVNHYLQNNPEKLFDRDIVLKYNLIYEHRKIGNNINQIAYSLNYILKAGLHNQLEETILDTEQKLENIQNQLNMLEATIEKRL